MNPDLSRRLRPSSRWPRWVPAVAVGVAVGGVLAARSWVPDPAPSRWVVDTVDMDGARGAEPTYTVRCHQPGRPGWAVFRVSAEVASRAAAGLPCPVPDTG